MFVSIPYYSPIYLNPKTPSTLAFQKPFCTRRGQCSHQGIQRSLGSKSFYKVTTDEYATSFLRSRSGRFIISPTGILLNNKEIEELGYWAEQRVARLLPVDYVDEEVARPKIKVDNLLAGSTVKEATTVCESVYLRTTIHREPDLRVETGKKTIVRFYAAAAAATYDVFIAGLTELGEPIHQRIELKVSE